MKFGRVAARAVVASLALSSPAAGYNSEEHKLLVDRAAPLLRIHPSIRMPPEVRLGVASNDSLLTLHGDAKQLAVGYRNNDASNYDQNRMKVQDNCFWNRYAQLESNKKNYIPKHSELKNTTLLVGAVVNVERTMYTIGELAALYGDYRRTVHCEGGDCYLTNKRTPFANFNMGCTDCSYCPPQITMRTYLRYVANGVIPPYGSLGNTVANTAGDTDYDQVGWWGDEMIRIANVNDWHFSTGAVAWYVGMHRLALHYVNLARTNNEYWIRALHYEASALHSLTDLFAFGHVVTNRDRTSWEMMKAAGLLTEKPYLWMENALLMGGGDRNDQTGQISIGTLPPIQDAPVDRIDFLPSYTGNWRFYGLQEYDFHTAFNGAGATVRNLNGDQFDIYGDYDFRSTVEQTRAIIVEAVRTSLQSLFDAYVELQDGGNVEQIGAAGSPYLAALRSLPVFVESSPWHEYYDSEKPSQRRITEDNFNGQWTRYARDTDRLAGTNLVPDTCTMQYVWGALEFTDLNSDARVCDTFPLIVVGPAPTFALGQSYPNPFATSTTIEFQLSRSTHTKVEIFNVAGARVVTLVDEMRPAGANLVRWDGVDGDGRRARSGFYYYRLAFDGQPYSRRVLLVR